MIKIKCPKWYCLAKIVDAKPQMEVELTSLAIDFKSRLDSIDLLKYFKGKRCPLLLLWKLCENRKGRKWEFSYFPKFKQKPPLEMCFQAALYNFHFNLWIWRYFWQLFPWRTIFPLQSYASFNCGAGLCFFANFNFQASQLGILWKIWFSMTKMVRLSSKNQGDTNVCPWLATCSHYCQVNNIVYIHLSYCHWNPLRIRLQTHISSPNSHIPKVLGIIRTINGNLINKLGTIERISATLYF